MKFFVDLCAGLGGASRAFAVDVDWHVLQLDNNPVLLDYNPDLVMCDILDTRATVHLVHEWLAQHGYQDGDTLVVWASPTCLQFSNAYNAPGPVAKRAGQPYEPDMSLVLACRKVQTILPTTWWVLENVEGAAQTWFPPVLGKHRQRIGSFFLWGNFPLLAVDASAYRHRKKEAGDRGRWSEIRANLRAEVPLAYSQALLDAITNQASLNRWTA